MASVNVVNLLGRVGRDPEVRVVGDSKVANITIATSEYFKDKSGEKKETVQWHQVVAWGKTAETIEKYVKKGDQLYVSGKLVYEQWEKEGVKHTTAKVRIDQLVLLGGKKAEAPESDYSRPPAKVEDQESMDEMPF